LTDEKKREKDHSILRKKLKSKGYRIIDEFQCKGFNTNSFMRFFGGMNKGRPNDEDIINAKDFAQKLKLKLQKEVKDEIS
jgi:flavodoxin